MLLLSPIPWQKSKRIIWPIIRERLQSVYFLQSDHVVLFVTLKGQWGLVKKTKPPNPTSLLHRSWWEKSLLGNGSLFWVLALGWLWMLLKHNIKLIITFSWCILLFLIQYCSMYLRHSQHKVLHGNDLGNRVSPLSLTLNYHYYISVLG